MTRPINVFTVAVILSACSLCAFATEDKNPQTALPVDSHAQPAQSNDQKPKTSGEEASGTNSGADAEALIKEKESPKEGQKVGK